MARASISQYMGAVPDELTMRNMSTLMQSILTDLTALQNAIAVHTHGGITTGVGTSGVANAGTVATLNTTT